MNWSGEEKYLRERYKKIAGRIQSSGDVNVIFDEWRDPGITPLVATRDP